MTVGGVYSTRRDRDTELSTLTDFFLNTYTVEATINLSPSVRERLTPGGDKPFTKRNVSCTPLESRPRDHIVEFPLSCTPLLTTSSFRSVFKSGASDVKSCPDLT